MFRLESVITVKQ